MKTFRVMIAAAYAIFSFNAAFAQNMTATSGKVIRVRHIKDEFAITSLDDRSWNRGEKTMVGTYWSGVAAPEGRHFLARLLWSDNALYVRFEATQTEPLVVSDKPDTAKKTRGLWDRDVCEIFLAPNRSDRNKYFEFEIAPTGEWIDLGIHVLRAKRETDWDYSSGMESAAKVGGDKIVMAIKVPWKAFGKSPKIGDVWLGNLFRCIGRDPDRGYLSWQPTLTKEASFHVPSRFGEFEFVN